MKYQIFIIIIFAISCSGEQNNKQTVTESQSEAVQEIPSQESDEVTLQTLVSRDWKVDLVLDNGKINENSSWKDDILSFSEDKSFTWKGNDSDAKGSYTFDQDQSLIALESSTEEITSQWSIKYRSSMMVWIGSPQHGHQAFQLKLVAVSK